MVFCSSMNVLLNGAIATAVRFEWIHERVGIVDVL